MIKVTRNENLRPHHRDRSVCSHRYGDLVDNLLIARRLIRIANHFFCLKPGAVFSGYISEFDTGFFTMRLWSGGDLARTFVLSNLGYSGELHVDIPDLNGLNYDLLTEASIDKRKQPNFIAA